MDEYPASEEDEAYAPRMGNSRLSRLLPQQAPPVLQQAPSPVLQQATPVQAPLKLSQMRKLTRFWASNSRFPPGPPTPPSPTTTATPSAKTR